MGGEPKLPSKYALNTLDLPGEVGYTVSASVMIGDPNNENRKGQSLYVSVLFRTAIPNF